MASDGSSVSRGLYIPVFELKNFETNVVSFRCRSNEDHEINVDDHGARARANICKVACKSFIDNTCELTKTEKKLQLE